MRRFPKGHFRVLQYYPAIYGVFKPSYYEYSMQFNGLSFRI